MTTSHQAVEERQRPIRERHVSDYAELMKQVTALGLLKRSYGFYWSMIIGTVLVYTGLWVAVVLLGDTWYQLIVAALMGVVLTQFGFLGHEAAHRQIFQSHRWNEWTGRLLSGLAAGLSYGWWMNKHNRHHQAPNQMGKDPDIVSDVLAFTPADAEKRKGIGEAFAKRQGYWFFPLLFLEGINLHVQSVKTAFGKRPIKLRWVEITFLIVRLGGYVAVLFILLSPGIAAAFLGVQVGVFGFLLGAAFAPNHKGMPIVPKNAKVDFLRRQVLMSRNIKGGSFVDLAMGGLNYQIEHHLFPSMPRPNLRHAQKVVRDYCETHGVAYTETTLLKSYGIVVRYLNAVGLKARGPFDCPLVQEYRA
ncbi:acyl-CoA desaturase [Saxibacter everestensis]|uniref:Acyl-CoA desaturase n=1 Tax=Saxibacter everestensis TaxID=2909229 RepID=A0ABY8QX22_9MICO|nr:acyl-CoA desaturase [Brevibacteriaceae bacterium ZFBP1038]